MQRPTISSWGRRGVASAAAGVVAASCLVAAAAPVALASPTAPADTGSSDEPPRVRVVVDPPVPDQEVAPRRVAQAAEAEAPLDRTFELHSLPGSSRTIYLDFDGHTVAGTWWNRERGLPAATYPGWDLDGSPATFGSTERAVIQSIWARVAEDYAPFDVDVTTEQPSEDLIDRSGPGDMVFGTRALISDGASAMNAICGGGCGGVAIIDAFDESSGWHDYLQPAWVFPAGLGRDPKVIAEAVSHEVGHNLALDHDGDASNPSYHEGSGLWAPIMGSGYRRPVTQWSNGDYAGANNQQDDIAVIASHGTPLRADEGSTLPADGRGVITTRTDTDRYVLDACVGTLTVTATPASTSPNLDIGLLLVDQAGITLAAADPVADLLGYDSASKMGASLTLPLLDGSPVSVVVDGVGRSGPGGYSDYGSVGAYTLNVARLCVPTPLPPPPLPTTDPLPEDPTPTVPPSPTPTETTPPSPTPTEPTPTTPTTPADPTPTTPTDPTEPPAPEEPPATVPTAPRYVSARSGAPGGLLTATVTWRAPLDDGGAPITAYRVVATRVAAWGPVAHRTRIVRVRSDRHWVQMRLASGRYRFTVVAVNAVGEGARSAASNSVRAR